MAKAKKTDGVETLRKVYIAALGAAALSIDIAKDFYQKSLQRGTSVEKELNSSINELKSQVETFVNDTAETVKGQIEKGLETLGLVASKVQSKAKA
jgi:hypothetical protein